MTREIKFRAWCEVQKIMLNNVSTGTRVVFEGDAQAYNHDCEFMQYTGLRDKNGVEVYEHDIVDFKSFTALIIFDLGQFQAEFKSLRSLFDVKDSCLEGKVIGNYYENPELLKGEND